MRILDEEYYKRIYAPGNPIGTILRTPPPDFTELERISNEFEAWISEVHRQEAEEIARKNEEKKAQEKTEKKGEM